MLEFKLSLVMAIALSPVFAIPTQVTLQLSAPRPQKLHGRFLQITDMHPDPYYRVDASRSSSCHRRKPKKEKERSGYYGTSFSGCDSPLQLTNFTLDFLEKNWASEIDFVIWTGDNARHDSDRKLPRTPSEIYELNRAVATKMESVFSSRGIPVIPSLGNNDVWPHNIMMPGPNSVTYEFGSIWKSFIPFPSYQVFQRGAYFSTEVIPNSVAVISLNTMYFYDSNKAVGGCDYKDPDDPGNLQFDWLEVELKAFRDRDMHVWISGHIPPSPGNYFPECYVRYVELSLRFQDTILGHLSGHMNADHFFFLEAEDLQLPETERSQAFGHKSLYDTLLHEYSAIPKSSKKLNLDDFAVINVSPSLVPNPYLPTFRIFSYNITGISKSASVEQYGSSQGTERQTQLKRKHGHRRGKHGDKASQCKTDTFKNTWKCQLNEPWNSTPDSPSRKNTLWTPVGYAQYYIPHLDAADKAHRPKFKLEYLTFPPALLHPSSATDSQDELWYPIPLQHLPRSLRNVTVSKSRYAPYHMMDLTIPSWIRLAQKLADPEEKKLRKRFKKYMFLGGEEG